MKRVQALKAIHCPYTGELIADKGEILEVVGREKVQVKLELSRNRSYYSLKGDHIDLTPMVEGVEIAERTKYQVPGCDDSLKREVEIIRCCTDSPACNVKIGNGPMFTVTNYTLAYWKDLFNTVGDFLDEER